VIQAFDVAVKALLRELVALKSELRGEVFWKRKARRSRLREIKASGFTVQPQAEGLGPQSETDVVRDLLKQNGQRLLRYVRRRLWHVTTTAELPAGAIDARAVVDEVACRALTAPEKKPAQLGCLTWLYMLAWQEIARRRRRLKIQAQETLSLETPRMLNDDAEAAAGYDAEQPLDIIEMELQPPVVETKDLLPDMRVEPPDVIVGRQELLAQMRRTANSWSSAERELFELYFVEGFEPGEVATVIGQPVRRVRELITLIHRRLRTEVLEQALV
jgi:RNA polymerase sigma factor (sigma-70 family)